MNIYIVRQEMIVLPNDNWYFRIEYTPVNDSNVRTDTVAPFKMTVFYSVAVGVYKMKYELTGLV